MRVSFCSRGAGRSASGGGGLHRGGVVCIQGGWADHAPPPSDTTGYGQQAGGMHPTGMHSCYILRLLHWLVHIILKSEQRVFVVMTDIHGKKTYLGTDSDSDPIPVVGS